MIQDMFNPEYYFGAYEVQHKESGEKKMTCGLFRDLINHGCDQIIDIDSTKNIGDERLVYHCISVPGENRWVKEIYTEQSKTAIKCQYKHNCQATTNKRTQDDLHSELMETDVKVLPPSISTDSLDNENKRAKLAEDKNIDTQKQQSASVYNLEPYLPWPDESATSAIVKICFPCNYSLNDVVEFVGIVSMDPQLMPTHSQQDEIQMEEEDYQQPPPSMVPRLHTLKGFPLAHTNPLLPFQLQNEDIITMTSLCRAVRLQLHDMFEQFFNGDSLAADYLICHLISSASIRSNSRIVGKCSLNLVNANTFGANRLYDLLSSLVTKSVLLPLSLANLNNNNFIPTKDYKANRLMAGRLQLSAGTHLIIDETVLTEGQLEQKGVRNMAALDTLIKHQEVNYDFNFNKIDFNSDVPTLILSDKKSILTTDYVVPVLQSSRTNCDVQNFLEFYPQFRTYFTVVKFISYDHKFSSDMQKRVSDFFVHERQKDVKKMTEEIFHNFLSLSKLMSLSYGENELSNATWEKTKAMESERQSRF